MGWLDKSLTLCDDDSVGTSDGYIGDVLDFGVAKIPALFAYGNPMALMIVVRTALAGSGTPTGSFQLRVGSAIASSNISSGAKTIVQTAAIAAATWSKGAWWGVYLPVGSVLDYDLRYMQMYFDEGGTITAGKIDAHLVSELPAWTAMPSARNMLV